ncbi:MAG: hypothetical protein J6K72_06135 [Clostridia bacterium]|nr:hypothetical protein [Clostridia bacterium]
MSSKTKVKLSAWSLYLCNASMFLYILWLFLPVLQNLTGLLGGLITIALFAVGILLDIDYLRTKGIELFLRICAIILLPVCAFFFLHRGNNFLAFFFQHAMFWYPAAFCAYARQKNDSRITRGLLYALLFSVLLTSSTTIFWAIYCRVHNLDNYSRIISMGWIPEETADYIMRRNIGGYDLSYALGLSLPLICALIHREKGWLRWAFVSALLLLFLTLIATDYPYAMLLALITLFVVLAAWMFRFIFGLFHCKLSLGISLLCTLPLLLLFFLFRMQLIDFGAWLFSALHLENIADSFVEMRLVFTGQSSLIYQSDSRLIFFGYAWDSFLASPLIGTLGRVNSVGVTNTLAEHYAALGLSGHSDVMDILASMGILGIIVILLLIYTACRGAFQGIRKSPSFPYIILMFCTLFCMCLGATMVYSREIMLMLCIGTLLLMQHEQKHMTPVTNPTK